MSEKRETRNRKIVTMFIDRRRKGMPADQAIEEIFESKQNQQWCLSRKTLRQIVYDKNYGRSARSGA